MSENISFENTLDRLQRFRQKMRELKRAEEETLAQGEHGSAHFQHVNPDELTEEDAKIYDAYTNGSLTTEEFERYREQFAFSKIGTSRIDYAAYIGNRLQVDLLLKELEAHGIKLDNK